MARCSASAARCAPGYTKCTVIYASLRTYWSTFYTGIIVADLWFVSHNQNHWLCCLSLIVRCYSVIVQDYLFSLKYCFLIFKILLVFRMYSPSTVSSSWKITQNKIVLQPNQLILSALSEEKRNFQIICSTLHGFGFLSIESYKSLVCQSKNIQIFYQQIGWLLVLVATYFLWKISFQTTKLSKLFMDRKINPCRVLKVGQSCNVFFKPTVLTENEWTNSFFA